MRILLVGALSWNPERMRALCERGHELWGLWARSMAWDEGPYPMTDGCIRRIALGDAAQTIKEEKIDCVYSLYQVYPRRRFGPPRPGVERDVWTLLRALLRDRARGRFDAPILRHWGFDVYNLDPSVVRAVDGHVFCNRQKLEYLNKPKPEGGCGLDVFDGFEEIAFLDSDRPKLEFMNDRFVDPISDRDGELHTVCVGRPFNVDYVAAARRGIHVHIYGNGFDDALRTIARDLSASQAGKSADLLGRYLHVHTSLQSSSASWPEIQATKSRWVEEFSRYDAAWSYIGRPLRWQPLDDRAAIPNRLGTYLLAGLPIITDLRPGWYRYEELRRRGVEIELVDSDYDALRERLEVEIRSRERRAKAVDARFDYSFDATIDALLGALERARERYFAKSHPERSKFDADGSTRLIHFNTGPGLLARRPGDRLRKKVWRRIVLFWRVRRLARILEPPGDEH